MAVHPKKPIRLRNRTNYFVPLKDKVVNTVMSPAAYCFKQSKQETIETRLYYQYLYCQSVGGQVFFYTLTYNDKSCPIMYDRPCFDYDDLRDLLRGKFYHTLKDEYGTTFKYFIGAELGEGKGVRGFENNPHYHVLFFLEPDTTKSRVADYVKIDPLSFRSLVRVCWQGFDEDQGFHDYRDALHGIAREGKNFGVVTSYHAFSYCSKYVTKDVRLVQAEPDIERIQTLKYMRELEDSDDTYIGFFHSYIYEHYNIPSYRKGVKSWQFDDVGLIAWLLRSQLPCLPNYVRLTSNLPLVPYVKRICSEYGLWKDYRDFVKQLVSEKVADDIRIWRNRYCNKCRISHGLGSYAEKFITNKLNPSIPVPTDNGIKNRPIGLYYYRHLYCDVVKDEKTFNNLYILNDLGIRMKKFKLDFRIERLAVAARANYSSLFDIDINKLNNSSINTDLYIDSQFLDSLSSCPPDDESFRLYAVYKLVYEDRYFSLLSDGSFPVLDYHRDYERFLIPSYNLTSYNPLLLDAFLDNHVGSYEYAYHKLFYPHLRFFALLDLLSDYYFVSEDDEREAEYKRRRELKKFHNKISVANYFRSLCLS